MTKPSKPTTASSASAASPSDADVTPWWSRLLLPEHHPANLAMLRIILGSYYVYFLWDRRNSFIRVATGSDPEVFEPVGIASVLTQPIDAQLYLMLLGACQITAVLFTLGFLYRIAGPLFGLLMLFVLTYRQSFGFIYHTENLVALHALVLGFAPSAHVLSLDRWLLTSKRTLKHTLTHALAYAMQTGPAEPTASYRYGWPAQLILLVMGIAYWVAGMAKIGRSGVSLDWVAEAHLFEHIGDNALRYEFLDHGALPSTGLVFGLSAAAIIALSAGSLLMELTAPLLIVPGPLRVLIGLGLFSFHYGVLAVMGIPFHYQLRGFAFAPLVRWDAVLARLTPLVARMLKRGD